MSPFQLLLLAVGSLTTLLILRMIFVFLSVIYYSAYRKYELHKMQQLANCGHKCTLPAKRRRLYLVLGGCGPREQAACKSIVLAESVVEPSSSGMENDSSNTNNYEIWVLSPARKKLRYFVEESGVPAQCLRVKHASVDTVTNFTYHAQEIAAWVNVVAGVEFEPVVTIVTCPQHVSRAQICANISFIPLGIFPKVVPVLTEHVDNKMQICTNCVSGGVQNGSESWLRTWRDALRALSWTMIRFDGSFLTAMRHPSRCSPGRCGELDFDGVEDAGRKKD